MWRMLHGLALLVRSSPDREKTDLVYVLLHTLRLLLPCRMCRENMARHMTKIPIPARRPCESETAESVRVWLHEMHNAVNALRGKRAVSFQDGMHEELDSLRLRGQLVRRVANECSRATKHVAECVRERRTFNDVERPEIESAWLLYRASVPRLLDLLSRSS